MTYTSQVGQDEWVCKQLKHKRNGFFLDIGAYDGATLSNTHHLEHDLGWAGICIEPGLEEFKMLIKTRNCICINKAIYNKNTSVVMASEGLLRGIKEHLQCEAIGTEQTVVEAITMKKLLKDYDVPKMIDYISLDTEGSEPEILAEFPFDKYEVSLWTIEHNAYLDGGKLKEKVRKIMTKNGYLMVPESEQTVDVRNFEDWFFHKKMNDE